MLVCPNDKQHMIMVRFLDMAKIFFAIPGHPWDGIKLFFSSPLLLLFVEGLTDLEQIRILTKA